MKKLLFILPVLLLSSTVQINAMQDDDINNQLHSQNDNEKTLNKIHNIINKFQLNETEKDEILTNISNMNEYTLYWLSNILNKLPSDKTTADILINISKINNESTLSILDYVLYELPEACKTTDILKNISTMNDKDTLYKLYNVLSKLPKACKTTDILFNISKINNKDILSVLNGVLNKLPEARKTKNILLNISEINDKYALILIYNILYELAPNGITEEILLKIIKDISKTNDINTLRETKSLFSNLQGDGEPGDLFFKIGKNIKDMDEEQLYALSKVLDMLPKEKVTKDLLFNLSEMYTDKLAMYLYLVYYLPENDKTKDILFNISSNIRKMNKNELNSMYSILEILPSNKVTTEILTNILTMNKRELNNIYWMLNKLPSDKVTIELLTNISKINNKYALGWINRIIYLLEENNHKITEEILLKITKDISKINNINTLRETKSLFSSNMQGDGKPEDLFFKIGKNVKDMDEEQLYALSKVLDMLPKEKITEHILFNITKMETNKLAYLYLVLNKLPEAGQTKDILTNISLMDLNSLLSHLFKILSVLPKSIQTEEILLNISKIDNKITLFIIRYILERFNILQLDNITEEILFNIINMNRYPLTLMCYIFNEICSLDKSQLNKIKKETLLDIIKYIIKNKNNISTLKDIELVLSKLPEEEGIKNLFINIRKNISRMDKDSLSNIESNINKENNVDNLDFICNVINKLPPDKITPDVLKSISNMNCEDRRLYFLSKVLDILPEECKTEAILINIINIDKSYKLRSLRNIFHELPSDKITTEILLNIIKMSYSMSLNDLNNVLVELPDAGKTKDILTNISKINDKYALLWLRDILEKLPEEAKIPDILTNISSMDERTLYYLLNLLDKLLLKVTPETLFNLGKMDGNTLANLHKKISHAEYYNEENIQILREFGLLQ